MKLKISNLTYQRNGTRGTGFYHCLLGDVFKKNDRFLVTFETDEGDDYVIQENCRLVNLNDLSLKYDGEDIAKEIQQRLDFHLDKTCKKYPVINPLIHFLTNSVVQLDKF